MLAISTVAYILYKLLPKVSQKYGVFKLMFANILLFERSPGKHSQKCKTKNNGAGLHKKRSWVSFHVKWQCVRGGQFL